MFFFTFCSFKSQRWISPPLCLSVCLRTHDNGATLFFTVSPTSLSLPPASVCELARGPAPVRKGEGPRGREVPGLCSTRFPCFPQSADKAGGRGMLGNALAFPFGTPIMSCCDAADWRRSGCWRPVSGPEPPRAQRRSSAPGPASRRSPSCSSLPAGASETSCCPSCSPFVASPLCPDSWPAPSCVRCRRRRRVSGSLGARCSES